MSGWSGLLATVPRHICLRCRSCRAPTKAKPAKTCRMEPTIEPPYFKVRRPCKSDAELRARPRLGYPRCDIPYKPECMGLCFNQPRLDTRLYRPSKSLDRPFQVNWVDCVLEAKRPKRCPGKMLPPEINRRVVRQPRCPRLRSMCRTLKPIECRPLVPAPPTSENRCIKFPLCECNVAMSKTRCRIKPKIQATCKRIRTQYPSYSECQSADVNPARPVECRRPVSICEAWRDFRNRHAALV